ncbi:MAG: metallopeptidase TldD-related protein [Acidobacteriota bacterium]
MARPPAAGAPSTFTDIDAIDAVCRQVIEPSVADETEIVWFERRSGRAELGDDEGDLAATDDRAEALPATEFTRTILLRVVEAGRPGWHRTHIADAGELGAGLRQALAVATVQQKAPRLPVLPVPGDAAPQAIDALRDARVDRLDVPSARALLAGWRHPGETARLRWSATRLAVHNSHGVRRAVATTEVELELERGPSRVATAARSLDGLGLDRLAERCRGRSAATETSSAPLETTSLPAVFAPEAVIDLLDVLNVFAFAGRSYLDGTSFLSRHRGVQVFDPRIHLRDDGGDPRGLPFPFDLEGSPKRAIDLVVDGRPSTLALDQLQSARAGLEPTAQSVGGRDALFGNLFLRPGDATLADLLQAVGDGLWIGGLDQIECLDPTKLEVRAVARDVRRIRAGVAAERLPHLVWQQSLLGLLARLREVGREPVVRTMPSTPLGAISAPALAVESLERFALRSS